MQPLCYSWSPFSSAAFFSFSPASADPVRCAAECAPNRRGLPLPCPATWHLRSRPFLFNPAVKAIPDRSNRFQFSRSSRNSSKIRHRESFISAEWSFPLNFRSRTILRYGAGAGHRSRTGYRPSCLIDKEPQSHQTGCPAGFPGFW